MATYLELKQQAEKLMQEAEQLRVREKKEVVADIKKKIAAYGLSAEDLGLVARERRATPAKKAAGKKAARKAAKPARVVKYRSPNGETWSGGRGRKPRWVVEALASGRSLDDFLVK